MPPALIKRRTKPHMAKRIIIRTLLGIVILFIFVAGTISLTRGWNASRLQKFKREVRDRGEKLTVAELVPTPGRSNTIMMRLAATQNTLGRPAPMVSFMPIVRPGVAQATWKGTNAWTTMHGILDEAEVPLTSMRDALKLRQEDLGWDYTNWNSFPSTTLIDIRKSA